MNKDHSQTEVYELLSTKLVAPHAQTSLIPRQRLLSQLDRGLDHKINLISAPAGFGKTSLVSEWISGRRRSGHLPHIAWVALDESDNDPVRFWRYVLTACRAFGEEVSESALDLLNNSAQPSFEALLTGFINKLTMLSNRVVLVLEDYHFITAQPIHETLTFFIDHIPAELHLLLMTRSDPPLPLARLRARGELNELRSADLRFTLEETQAFLQQAVPFPIPAGVTARLAERTEGWAAGLRLVALALQGMNGQQEIGAYLTSFTGSHRPILEYLVDDVFNAQPQAVQEFLLQTSFLSRLSGPLCEAVTGREDSLFILEQLERSNLFLTSLDAAGNWYRYHALFAEAMLHYARQQLGMNRLAELAQKASVWYEDHGLPAEAVEAAIYAQDSLRAAGLVERIVEPQLVQNEYHTLRRWLENLPEAVLRQHPALSLTYAAAILFTTDRYSVETAAQIQPLLEMAEQVWRAEDNQPKLGELLAFRSLVTFFQWRIKQAVVEAKQALELLPEENVQWRSISLMFVGLEELLDGRLNTARTTLLETLKQCRNAGNIYAIIDAMLLLGRVYAGQGELRQAAQLYWQVLAEIEQMPMDREPAEIRTGRALVGLSDLDLEWNDLETAEQRASQALDIEQAYADEELRVQAALALARTQHARGETDQAQQRLQALTAGTKSAFLLREVQAVQARIALANGDLSAAEHWYTTRPQPAELPRLHLEQEVLAAARLLIEQGKAEEAVRQLENWLAEAQENGRTRSEIEIKLLLALAHLTLKNRTNARDALIQSLSLAQPEGYQRVFLNERERLADLLKETTPEIREEQLAVYARTLLSRIAQKQPKNAAVTPQDSELFFEPLSEQEQRVLRLLAAGLSNPEIGEELFISINTVKTHVKNIYGKLGVNNREDARDAARHLRLL